MMRRKDQKIKPSNYDDNICTASENEYTTMKIPVICELFANMMLRIHNLYKM